MPELLGLCMIGIIVYVHSTNQGIGSNIGQRLLSNTSARTGHSQGVMIGQIQCRRDIEEWLVSHRSQFGNETSDHGPTDPWMRELSGAGQLIKRSAFVEDSGESDDIWIDIVTLVARLEDGASA